MSVHKRAVRSLAIALSVALIGLVIREGRIVGLAIPFFLYAASLLISEGLLPAPKLRAERTLDLETINEGEEVGVTLKVVNEGRPLLSVSIEDGIPAGGKIISGENRLLGPLEAGAGRTISYTIVAGRGRHPFGPVKLVIWSGYGLSYRTIRIRCPSALSVLPTPERLDPIAIRPRRIHAFTGPVMANRGGSGLDLFGCRAYQPGDDIRRINWRASARREELIINEYEQERMTDVDVILDVRALVHVAIGNKSTFDLSVKAAASIAAHFIAAGNRVGLLVYGDYLDWIYPAAGRLQLDRILRSLARAEPADRAAFGELNRIPTQLFAPGSQLVIISPLGNPDDIEVPALFVARGYSVLLVHVNSLELERSALPKRENVELALRILRLKERVNLASLAASGVRLIDWDVTEPLGISFHYARLTRERGIG